MSQLELDAKNIEVSELYRVSARKKGVLQGKKYFLLSYSIFYFMDLRFLKKDERVGMETAEWEDGFTCGIGMGDRAPALYMKKTDKGLIKLPSKAEEIDLMIQFKSVEAAFQVMSGQIGVAGSYARHGFTLKGDIARAMSIVRCVDLAEGYLFPKFISKRILKEVPEKKMGLLHTYLSVIGQMILGGK